MEGYRVAGRVQRCEGRYTEHVIMAVKSRGLDYLPRSLLLFFVQQRPHIGAETGTQPKAAICRLGGHTLGGLAYRTLMLPNMSIREGLSRFQMEEYGKEQAAKNERIAGAQTAAGLCSCLLSGSIYVCYFHKSPFSKRRHIWPDFLFLVIKRA